MNNNELKSEISSEGYNERKKRSNSSIQNRRVMKSQYHYAERKTVDENQPAMMFHERLKEFWEEWGKQTL